MWGCALRCLVYAASFGGHFEIVQILFELGANANAQGEEYRDVLYTASSGGHLEIV